jgi:hypothetical protein
MITPGVGVYEGQWVAGLREDPRATVRYDNGEVYVGGFVGDTRSGPADWRDAKGSTFHGRFAHNEKDLTSWTTHQLYDNGGQLLGLYAVELVVCLFPRAWARHRTRLWWPCAFVCALRAPRAGDVYDGPMQGLKRNGEGVLVTVAGVTYKGTFVADELEGEGDILSALWTYHGDVTRSKPHVGHLEWGGGWVGLQCWVCLCRRKSCAHVRGRVWRTDLGVQQACSVCFTVCLYRPSLTGKRCLCIPNGRQVRGRVVPRRSSRTWHPVVRSGWLLQGRRTWCMAALLRLSRVLCKDPHRLCVWVSVCGHGLHPSWLWMRVAV